MRSLVGTRPRGNHVSTVDRQQQQQPEVVEIPSEIPTHRPQLPAASSQPAASQEGIWEIFRDHEGRITQERRDLKETGKRDYIVRLAHLYLYARHQHDDEKVPRDDVFKILDEAGVKDNHRSTYIYKSGIHADENQTLRLTLDGRDRAQRYLAEALDQISPEGWRLGAESRSGGNLTKKQSKKGSEPLSDTVIAGWVSHEATTELVKTTPHGTIDTMRLRNRALFALYCLEKAGVNTEVQSSQIARYLFAAFQIQIKAKSIPQALAKAVENKPAYATYRKDSGYRITTSEIEHIESLLKSKQTEHTLATTAEANGAVPV